MISNQRRAINSRIADSQAELLTAALEYQRRGWSIIPVIGKKPAWAWKNFQEQPADSETLRRLFSRPGITGLAVILGKVSGGLAVRDFDRADTYQAWATANADAAATLPTAKTSRGFHVYGQHDDEAFHDFGDGELRGDARHYVLAPPSAHPDGPTYTWVVPLPSGALPCLPESLLPEHSSTHATQATQHTPHTPHTTHLCEQGSIPTAIAETLPRGIGQRRAKLFDLARRLKSIMPDAGGNELKPIVREWFDLALAVIGTKDFSSSWEDFVTAWKCVRHTTGGRWIEIVASSESIDVDTGDHDRAAAAIIRMAAALQANAGDGVAFPLSCRRAGEVAGISHERAARVLKTLAFEGVLKLVKRGGAKGSKKAAEYIFLGIRS